MGFSGTLSPRIGILKKLTTLYALWTFSFTVIWLMLIMISLILILLHFLIQGIAGKWHNRWDTWRVWKFDELDNVGSWKKQFNWRNSVFPRQYQGAHVFVSTLLEYSQHLSFLFILNKVWWTYSFWAGFWVKIISLDQFPIHFQVFQTWQICKSHL